MYPELTDNEVASLIGVTARTVRNYRRHGFPPLASIIIDLHTGKHHDWLGYRFRPGAIITPEGDKVTASQISHYSWLKSELDQAAARSSELQLKLRKLENFSNASNNAELCNALKLMDG